MSFGILGFDDDCGAIGLRRPSRHQSMFKYVSLGAETSWEHLERTLNEFTLLGATAASLNDPFELSPHIFDDLSQKNVASILRRIGNSSDDEISLDFDINDIRNKAFEFTDGIVNNSRIVSFCERSDSPLLWSHYANKYKGACIHFLGRAFGHKELRVGYVNYSAYRPMMPLSLPMSVMNYAEKVNGIRVSEEIEKSYFFSKAADWAYENEIRILYSSPMVKAARFSRDGLVSIITGPRMDDADRERLREMVCKSAIPELPVRNATLSKNSFSVNVD